MLPLLCGSRDPAPAGGGGGDETLISVVTVTNAAGTAKTNEPVEFGFPLADTELPSSGAFLKIYDDDGAGGQGALLANYQFDNHATDLSNAVRFAKGSCVVPALAGSATRKLHVCRAAGSAPANTAITVADILATSYDVAAEFNIAGTVYSASARTALNGVSSWSPSTGRTDAVLHGTWRQNGACTEYVCSLAPRTGGAGTEHASGNGLRVWFHIAAWKAGAAAVGGGNPITYVRTRVVLENGALERASPAHYWYGFSLKRATSLANATLISSDDSDVDGNALQYDWPRAQPAATLTLSDPATGTRTLALSAGAWAADIKGAHLVNAGGAGKAYVRTRDSNTQVTAQIYEAFTAGSYTASNWTIEGVGHPYGCRWFEDVHIGTKPTNVCVPANVSSAVTPANNGLRDRLRNSRMVVNYQNALGDISHDMTALNAMRANGRLRPFVVNGPTGGAMGETATDQGAGGARDDIAYLPEWDVDAILKYDANGRRRMLENARYLSLENWHLTRPYTASLADGARGVAPSPASGLSYKFNPLHNQANQINEPALRWDPYDGDISHMPAFGYVPYLLTGDFFWLEAMQFKIAGLCQFAYNDGYNGSGANKTHCGDATRANTTIFGENQTRGIAWGVRDVVHAVVCTPDAARDLLYIPKASLKTHVTKTWDAARYGDLNTDAGLNIWTASGPHVPTGGGNGGAFGDSGQFAPWMVYYFMSVCTAVRELGMADSDFNAFMTWMAETVEGAYGSTDVAPDRMTTAYWCPWKSYGGGALTKSWANVYRKGALAPMYDGASAGQQRSWLGKRPGGSAAQNVTLSATSGPAVTVTLPVAAFTNGGSWYVDGTGGGWIELRDSDTGSGDAQAWGRITAVSPTHASDRQFTMDTTGSPAWPATSIPANRTRIPDPHPADAEADGTLAGRNLDYMHWYWIACNALLDFGRGTPAQNAKTYITTATGWSAPGAGAHRLNIGSR